MNETTTESTKLAVIVKESGLEQSKGQILLEKFTNFFEIAADWERKAKELVITEVTQVVEMKRAEEGMKFLKSKRIEVEKTRKTLKEASLKESQTIDSIARILKNLIEPVEADLEKKANFEKYKIAEEREKKEKQRMILLEPYDVTIDKNIVANMADEMFDVYLKGVKQTYEEKKALKQVEEQKSIKDDEELQVILQKEREKNELKIRRINELSSLGFVFDSDSYKCYSNVIFIRQIEEENDHQFAEFLVQSKSVIETEKAAEEKLKKEKEKLSERINKVVALGFKFDFKENYTKEDFNVTINEIKCDTDEVFNRKIEKISNEITEREKISEQQEIKFREDFKKLEEQKNILQLKVEKVETVEIKKKLSDTVKKTAPDKTKLMELSKAIDSIEFPVIKTEEANMILNDVKVQLSKISSYIKTSSETL